MGKIEWAESLSVGVDSIDNEHKRLIKIANAVVKMARDSDDRQQLTRAMSYLREYTVTHFANEEEYMVSIGFDELAKHQREHAELKQKVKDFQSMLFHSDVVNHEEVLVFLKDWLVGHVLKSDMKIKDFMENSS